VTQDATKVASWEVNSSEAEDKNGLRSVMTVWRRSYARVRPS
jgi:hypothetical protein